MQDIYSLSFHLLCYVLFTSSVSTFNPIKVHFHQKNNFWSLWCEFLIFFLFVCLCHLFLGDIYSPFKYLTKSLPVSIMSLHMILFSFINTSMKYSHISFQLISFLFQLSSYLCICLTHFLRWTNSEETKWSTKIFSMMHKGCLYTVVALKVYSSLC